MMAAGDTVEATSQGLPPLISALERALRRALGSVRRSARSTKTSTKIFLSPRITV